VTVAPRRRLVAGIAMGAVLLASADTYVIVLALPAIMAGLGIGLDQLQAATPIVSGFLLGYVVVLPLLGRLSDVYGRRRLLLVCLGVFAAGSLVTASATSLSEAVFGRALQGLGGGGLVPVTLALVADWWRAEERGVPLGVAGGLQELGSVAGPLYGALILSVSTWRTIFWINLPLTALLAAALMLAWPSTSAGRWDVVGAALAVLCAATAGLAIAAPPALVENVALGTLYLPVAGIGWLTPLSTVAAGAAVAFIVWELALRRRPAASLAALRTAAANADWPASALVAAVLAAVVVTFAAADPSTQALNPLAPVLLPVAALLAAGLVIRERRAARPLLPGSEFRPPRAWGALLTNLLLGAALMAALVDVPIYARATAFTGSQFDAALELVRLLVAVPVGALLGGRLLSRLPAAAIAAAGLALSALAFVAMTSWSATTLTDAFGPGWLHPSDPVLVAGGLGFGLAIAPVNASLLAAVRAAVHGLASSLLVVARMAGMLAGISVLTAIGLHAFYHVAAGLPTAITLCPSTPLDCAPYERLVTSAIVTELHAVFVGAAVCAGLAALVAGVTLRTPRQASRMIAGGV